MTKHNFMTHHRKGFVSGTTVITYSDCSIRILTYIAADDIFLSMIHVVTQRCIYIPCNLFFCKANFNFLEVLFFTGCGDKSDNLRTCFPDLVARGGILTTCVDVCYGNGEHLISISMLA